MAGVLTATLGRSLIGGGGGGSGDVLLNRSLLNGFTFDVPATVQTSQSVTVTAIGGTPPYTYLWTFVSGDTDTYATSSANPTTFFQRYSASAGTESAQWKCVVTDSLAVARDSEEVTIQTTVGGGT